MARSTLLSCKTQSNPCSSRRSLAILRRASAVPVVMLSHRAQEADVKKALNEIGALDVTAAKPVLIRIEDESLQD